MKKLSIASLSLSIVFGALAAFAQAPSPTPPAAAQTRGAVSRAIVGPMGRLQGVQLQDGSVVMLRHADPAAAQRLMPGTSVQVEGFARPGAGTTVYRRATVRDASGNVIVAAPQGGAMGAHGRGHGRGCRGEEGAAGERGPRAEGRRGMHGARFAQLQALPVMDASGPVRSVIAGPRGGVRTLLVGDDTTVVVPRGLGRALAERGVRAGERVQVRGRGGRYPQGASVIAERITLGDGTTLEAPARPAPPTPVAR